MKSIIIESEMPLIEYQLSISKVKPHTNTYCFVILTHFSENFEIVFPGWLFSFALPDTNRDNKLLIDLINSHAGFGNFYEVGFNKVLKSGKIPENRKFCVFFIKELAWQYL